MLFVCFFLFIIWLIFFWLGIDNYFFIFFVRVVGNYGYYYVIFIDKFVGFFVGLIKMFKINDIDLVVYDCVFFNMGNGYDFSIGVFICFNVGIYVFLVYGVFIVIS